MDCRSQYQELLGESHSTPTRRPLLRQILIVDLLGDELGLLAVRPARGRADGPTMDVGAKDGRRGPERQGPPTITHVLEPQAKSAPALDETNRSCTTAAEQ